MKRRKNSQVLLLLLIVITVVHAMAFTYHLSNNLEEKPVIQPDVWLLGKGDYFIDTIYGNYQHLVSDFPLMELTGQYRDMLIVEGYENGRKHLKKEIRNDTLFVRNALPDSDTVAVAVDGDYPILVTIGAKDLKSITLKDEGRIDIPVNPYGANPGGNVVYKPEDWEKYVLRLNSLDLYLLNGIKSEFFLEIDSLNIHVQNNNSLILAPNSFASTNNYLSFTGNAKKVRIDDPQGVVLIEAEELKTDTLIVRSNHIESGYDIGYVRINCNDYIDADLRYAMDIVYTGTPSIKKKERDFGRVIKVD